MARILDRPADEVSPPRRRTPVRLLAIVVATALFTVLMTVLGADPASAVV